MGLYKWIKSEKEPKEQNEEFFNPVELEQAFDRAYRSYTYRINEEVKWT